MLQRTFSDLASGAVAAVDENVSGRVSNCFSKDALKEIIRERVKTGDLVKTSIGYDGFGLMPKLAVLAFTKNGKQTKLTAKMPIACREAEAAGWGSDPNNIQPQISDIIWRDENDGAQIPSGFHVSHRCAADDLKAGTPRIQLVCVETKDVNESRKYCNLYGLMFKKPSTHVGVDPVAITLADFAGGGYHGPTCCPHAGTPGGMCYATLKPFEERRVQPTSPLKRKRDDAAGGR